MTIHILHRGFALCGAGAPVKWPKNDKWVRLYEAEKATCVECKWRAEVLPKKQSETSETD